MPRVRKPKPAPPSPPPKADDPSDSEDIDVSSPPTVDPYAVLCLDRTASPDQVKAAYRRQALLHHPDKVDEPNKAAAHTRFQEIAFAYAVLSDPTRRARYDATGSTAESLHDGEDGFSWAEYFREQFRDAISAETIAKFAREYKGSEEERSDVLRAYEECEGDMDGVFEHVMLCETAADQQRIIGIIKRAIKQGDAEMCANFAREDEKKQAARAKKSLRERGEAIELAKELGVHDKLFGAGPATKRKKKAGGEDGEDGEDGLAALIRARQKERNPDAFFDHLLDKYGPKSGNGKSAGGGKKGTGGDEKEEEVVPRVAIGRKRSKR